MRSWTLGTIGVAAVVAGCADPSPVKQTQAVARVDLIAALGSASVHPVGVAVAPGGDRFVFDQTLGLYRIGSTTAVVPMSSLPAPDKPIQLPITGKRPLKLGNGQNS